MPRVMHHKDLMVKGEINERRVADANSRHASTNWYPNEHARGLAAAIRQTLDDYAHEARTIYFTPRYLGVRTKIKVHTVYQSIDKNQIHDRIHHHQTKQAIIQHVLTTLRMQGISTNQLACKITT